MARAASSAGPHTVRFLCDAVNDGSDCAPPTEIQKGYQKKPAKSPIGKAVGDDKIHNEYLLKLVPKRREFLLSLLNMRWKQGHVPHSWRRATIIPIKKAEKPSADIGSYRPISLTSCVAKLAEELIKERLCWWLEQHQVLAPTQCGFCARRSTTDLIARLQQKFRKAIRRNQPSGR